MLSELISEQELDKVLGYFGRNKRKFSIIRAIYGVLFGIIGLGVFIYLKDFTYLILVPALALLGYKLPYHGLLTEKKKRDTLNSHMFPQFVTNFLASLPTSGNVYQTLVETLPFTEDPMRRELEKLIGNIEEKNDREDYLDFAEYVGTSDAYMVMDVIYQFSEYGIKSDALRELQVYILELEKNKMDELIERKIVGMDYIGYIPIFISMFMLMGFAGVLIYHYLQESIVGLGVL